LISIGLSEREARLYYILLSKGENRAREITNLSGIPQPHVYSLLKSMHGKGLVEILQGEVKKYGAVPIDLAIDKLIGEKERALASLKNKSREIAQKVKVDEKEIDIEEESKPISGKKKIVDKSIEMIQAAKREVLCTTSSSELLEYYEKYEPDLKLLRSRGINLRVLTDGKKIENVKNLIDAGTEIRFLTKMYTLRKLIVDEEEALLDVSCIGSGKPWDFGIWTNHEEVVTRLREEFEELWDKAKVIDVLS